MTWWLRARLVLDRLLGVIGSILLAPVIGALALLVRREDGGPGLITVARIGRHGRPFRMWKVRSMRVTQDDGGAGGPALTTLDDQRITAIGRRLRAYHLDELPQLINVARGEMLLLGPRPEAPEFVDPEDARWQHILSCPPGIAGPTQVIVNDWERDVIARSGSDAGYCDEVLPVKLAIDGWYLGRCSPITDALVAITLARRFLPGTESTTLKKRVFAAVPEAAVVRAWLRSRSAAAALGTSSSAGHDATDHPDHPEAHPTSAWAATVRDSRADTLSGSFDCPPDELNTTCAR